MLIILGYPSVTCSVASATWIEGTGLKPRVPRFLIHLTGQLSTSTGCPESRKLVSTARNETRLEGGTVGRSTDCWKTGGWRVRASPSGAQRPTFSLFLFHSQQLPIYSHPEFSQQIPNSRATSAMMGGRGRGQVSFRLFRSQLP
ncbi:hypothetical protein BDV10DRAFT_46293 [Aspergillus recurvatus]